VVLGQISLSLAWVDIVKTLDYLPSERPTAALGIAAGSWQGLGMARFLFALLIVGLMIAARLATHQPPCDSECRKMQEIMERVKGPPDLSWLDDMNSDGSTGTRPKNSAD